VLRDPVAEFRGVVLDVHQVEPDEHLALLRDEHVEGADACLLLIQQSAEPGGELVEEALEA
jgi:hypothetical protein